MKCWWRQPASVYELLKDKDKLKDTGRLSGLEGGLNEGIPHF